jgi:pyridoxal phosphate enzyme (YggS family)
MTEYASDRLQLVQETMRRACQQAGREETSVQLVAVSKTHPAEAVRELAECGQSIFAESRVQEALIKIPQCPGRLHWHFIGHLQKNKIRKALPHFTLFHGVDNLELAEEVQRIASEEGQRPGVLLEVNTSGEASKFGFHPDQLEAQLEDLLELPRLEICGLMTMAPVVPKPEMARPFFARLRELRDRLEEKFGVKLPELSMGMSGDYEAAIVEGSTLVRVGTALFGDRKSAATD